MALPLAPAVRSDIILELLKTETGLKELQDGGSYFGITIHTQHWNNIIDYGVIQYQALPLKDITPLGYEDCSDDKQIRQAIHQFSVNIEQNYQGPGTYQLASCLFLPSTESNIEYIITHCDGTDAIGSEINSGEATTLQLRLNITPEFQGYVNRWMILTFDGVQQHTRLSSTISRCVLSVRVSGCVQNDFQEKVEKSLSTDAAPFIPHIATSYFDTECLHIYLPIQTIDVNLAPPNYMTILSRLWNHNRSSSLQIDPYLINNYTNAINTNNFRELLNYYGIDPNSRVPFGQSPYGVEAQYLNYLLGLAYLNKMEELHFSLNICRYDIRYASIKYYVRPESIYGFEIIVQGSNENRPKVLVGDCIRLRPVAEDCELNLSDWLSDVCHLPMDCSSLSVKLSMFEINAIVSYYDLRTEKVTCKCSLPPLNMIIEKIYQHQSIEVVYSLKSQIMNTLLMIFSDQKLYSLLMSKLRYHIRFSFEPTAYSLIHKAIGDVMIHPHLQKRLFPSPELTIEPRKLPPLKSSVLNRRQQEAVSAISYLCASPLFPSAPPYIIFGPPGTGKTITLIEIIREVFQQNRSVKILACAPSDAAADVLCLRLAKYFSTTQLFRLNWWQRLIASVPIEILNYCHLHNENCFDLPPYEVLNRFNIIVTTTVTCGFLNCCPLPLVFDLILIDEVSQATEAETFVPISLCSPNGIVVLAGDPEQLGPSVRSPAYHLKGMSKSLIEKLLKQQLYQDVRPDVHEVLLESPNKSFLFSKFGTYLTLNYRSQKSIISLPSQLFYKNSLQEGQDRQQLDSLGSWKYLNNAKLLDDDEENNENRPFVVLFKGVDGRHRHEIDSPAFYNIEEISAVVEICSSLIFEYGKELQISTKDIGVIGAFRSQVLKLRLALRAAQLGGINVGSVEDFQGQETRIIIISTVLTHRIPHLEMNGSLGLLGDHRKFNVSLTRGMHLAIIVGHPYCLHTDPNWRQLMNYCDRHGTYTGYSCTLLDRVQDEINQENELLNSIARISLLGNTSTSSSDSWNTTSKNGGNQYFPETLEWRGLL